MPNQIYARVGKSQTSGNGLFADKAIPAGELILSISRPLVGVVEAARLSDTCANCFKWTAESSIGSRPNVEPNGVKACTGCRTVGYCSKECQKAGWKRHHKYECEIMASTVSKGNMPTAARATMQFLIRRAKGLINDETWESVLRLESHIEEMRAAGGEKWLEVQLVAQGAWAFSMTQAEFTLGFTTEVFGRVLTNSITLVTPTYDPVGICIDPLAAVANQSCDPNAVVVMDGPVLSFRSLRPIKKDEEIFISYVDGTNPFARRQQELKQRWHFTCKCTKCQKGPTSPSDLFSISPNNLDAKWKETADHLLRETPFANEPANYVGDDLNSRRAAVIQGVAFNKLETARSTLDPRQAISLIEDGIRTCFQSKLFPVYRQPYAALRHDLLVNMISAGNHGIAFAQGAKSYFHVDPVLFPESHHPVRVVHNWRLAMLLMYLGSEPDDPMTQGMVQQGVDIGIIIYGLLIEVQSNVPLSHGKDSSFARAVKRKVEEVEVDMTRADAGALRGVERRIAKEWELFRQMGGWMQY
ncbi:SET domain-containing protein [Mytilinidion resinicola]|uniref:SET domain-containing protein n=1 Tax=Mytilinidion resinicola TaxID=574789 RepID=A0A6A6YJ54_9PEZI|nr:SET domain-containing protein [Mytilinidion resinicola]KAF2808553.1 SET domain-containing protein [Mytilinidion resinicola]